MGWALAKTRSGPSQFSEKDERLFDKKKFDLGERTGQKADAQQVAMGMRSARTLDNQRIFCRHGWPTKAQVQGFFSRLASARRKQGYSGDNTSKDDTNQGEEDEERCKDVEEVMENLGLKHPIVFDLYNLVSIS